MVAAGVACALVAAGLTQGLWWSNVHNGLLGVTLSLVGLWLATERPRSRQGALFLGAGLVEAVMFAGRQVGHTETGQVAAWLGWLGVWPIAVGMLATTVAVVCFPDGHLPSRRWRPALGVAAILSLVCAGLSALWATEWDAAGLDIEPPFSLPGRSGAETVWAAVAHPLYLALQLSWVVAVAVRWRAGRSRAPLLGLLLAAGAAFVVLIGGGVALGSVRPGLVAVSLVPLLAGWSALHGHQLARYRTLSWLTEAGEGADQLPTALARTVTEALDAPGATVWLGNEAALHVVGIWPEAEVDEMPRTLAALDVADGAVGRTWPVWASGQVVGALTVPTDLVLTAGEERMMADLVAQAAVVLDRISLAEVVQRERTAGHLGHLTPRERDVLELMARGLTNAAICQELHLSIKTVEPLVSTVFGKLGLHADPTVNRRVLAALEYRRG